MQVLEQDPFPPSQLNDSVPRDLESICLKCLSKEPSDRYSTAGEVADDLRRFIDGERSLANRRSLVVDSWALKGLWVVLGSGVGAGGTAVCNWLDPTDGSSSVIIGAVLGAVLVPVAFGWNSLVAPLLVLSRSRHAQSMVCFGVGALVASAVLMFWAAIAVSEPRPSRAPYRVVVVEDERGNSATHVLPPSETRDKRLWPALLLEASTVFGILGAAFCLAAPVRVRTHGLLILLLLLDVAMLYVRFLSRAIPESLSGSASLQALQIFTAARNPVWVVLFAIVVARLAGYVDRRDLQRQTRALYAGFRARHVVVAVATLVAGGLVIRLLAPRFEMARHLWTGLIFFLLMGFGMYLMFMVYRTIRAARKLQLGILRRS